MHWKFLALAPLMIWSVPASAQTMVDPAIWGNGILGQQNLRNTYDNYDRANGIKPESRRRSATACSADSLPAADRRRIETEYSRRVKADGKASAYAWVQEQGMRYRNKLIADGVCDDPRVGQGTAQSTRNKTSPRNETRASPKRQPVGRDGKPCTKTRLENRPIASLGGGAMTLGLVPVCAD